MERRWNRERCHAVESMPRSWRRFETLYYKAFWLAVHEKAKNTPRHILTRPPRSDTFSPTNHRLGRPTLFNVSTTLAPGFPGTTVSHISSPSLSASDKMVQLGLWPALSHLKSSTWSH